MATLEEQIATIEADVAAGIPSGVWADAWASQEEENGASFSGCDLMDVAPKPSNEAVRWGVGIAADIVKANGKTLAALYAMARDAGYPYDASHFGYHLGMQAVGHGVSFSDDCKLPHDSIKVPHSEFYL